MTNTEEAPAPVAAEEQTKPQRASGPQPVPDEVYAEVQRNGLTIGDASGHASIVNGQCASLYVYGLPADANAAALYKLFCPFGGILNVRPIYDLKMDDKPCKGFAFVNFRKYEDACFALVAMNGYNYEGKQLQVSFKQTKSSDNDASTGLNSFVTPGQYNQGNFGRPGPHHHPYGPPPHMGGPPPHHMGGPPPHMGGRGGYGPPMGGRGGRGGRGGYNPY